MFRSNNLNEKGSHIEKALLIINGPQSGKDQWELKRSTYNNKIILVFTNQFLTSCLIGLYLN